MLAAQRMQDSPRRAGHDCVSNGFLWQFDRLTEKEFVKELRQFVFSSLPELCAVWNCIFIQAREQAPAA